MQMRKIPFFRFILPAVALTMASVSAPSMAAEITRVVSPGGIEAWLVNEPSIPIISLEVAWEGGARLDPEAKTGLANMVSGLLDEGAGDMDSAAFQAKLKDLAIALSFNAGKDTFRGSLRTLTKNRDEAFALFAQAIVDLVEEIEGAILFAHIKPVFRADAALWLDVTLASPAEIGLHQLILDVIAHRFVAISR